MKNSKILKIFAVLMAVTIIAGCGGNTDTTSSTDVQTPSGEASMDFSDKEMVDIVVDGEAKYAVIRAKDGTDTEKALASNLHEKIETMTGATPKLRSDTKEAEPYEIVVGNANRSAVQGLNLAENEYIVSHKDNTIVIYGGSDKALGKAYDYFVQQFLTSADGSKLDKVSVPVEFTYTGSYKSREEQLKETALIQYPEYPEDVVPRDYDYTVKVTQGSKTIEIPVYNAVFTSEYFNSSMDGDWHRRFCEFAFSGEPVTIEVTVNMDFSSYSVMPSSKEIPSTCNKNVITYTLDKPETTVIKINSNRDTLLAIFAEDPITDEEIPDKNAANVMYYPAGYHEIDNGHLDVPGGTTVYLEPGAIVAARVTLSADCKLIGRGAFIEPSPTRMPVDGDKRYFLTLKGSNITVDGIKLLDSHDFNIICFGLRDSVIKDVKVLSNQISTDGFTTGGMCENVEIYDCFWHVSDNVFVIGGGGTTGFKNVNVHDCIVASDYATFFPQESAIGPGEMNFKNIDVLRVGSFLKITYNPSNTITGFSGFNLENIYAMDVDTEPRFIWIENFIGSALKQVNMKNVVLNKIKSSGLEIASNCEGFEINFDNVWINGELFTADSKIKNTMNTSKNTFNFTSTKDAAAAKVNVKTANKVSAYTAEKIKIGEFTVGTKVQPYTENGVTYVSAYEIVKELGFENVKLDEKTGTLTFKDSKKEYTFKAEGSNVLKNGRLMVPLAFFKEIGSSASYDQSKKTVTVDNIARRENLVYNGGFEDGLCIEWTTRNFSKLYLSTEANSGKYAIRVEKGEKTAENGIYYDVANILRKNGRGTYKLTAWVKKAPGTDSTKISIGIVTGYNVNSAADSETYKLTDSWQKIECQFRASDVGSLKNVGFFVGAADGSNIKYLIDDLSFEKIG